jgi:two-component system response regulator FixJ
MFVERCVYIVDDDEAVRDSLSVLLESRTYAVKSFGSAPEFLAAAPSLPVGCLIVDIRMPEMDGLELQQCLTRRGLSFPLIVITGHGDVPLAVRVMKAGAVDFIEKPFTSEAILNSLAMALSRLSAPSEQDPTAIAAAAKLALLSPREREVLEGLIAGLPNKTIAYDLAISPRTVEVHRARVMDKMGARSLSELVRLALAAGVRPSSSVTKSELTLPAARSLHAPNRASRKVRQ